MIHLRTGIFVAAVTCLTTAATPGAFAQSRAQGQGGSPKAPAMKRIEATASIGWFGADKTRVVADRYNRWYASRHTGVGVGYYWTELLKTEIEAASTNEGEVFSQGERVPLSTGYTYRYSNHYYSNRKLSLAQTFQFGHNAWVHPYVGAGIDVDWERHRSRSPAVISYERVGTQSVERVVAPPSTAGPDTDLHVKPMIFAGAKIYFSPRTFMKTDAKFAGVRDLEQVTWRFAFGIDF
jgi:hypothetical protein